MIRSLAILVVIFAACSAVADEPVTIPLKDIWALDMPGTRDIEGLDLPAIPQASFTGWGIEEFKRFRQQVIEKLRRSLSAKPPAADALSGFVVPVPPGMDLLTVLNNRVVQDLAKDGSLLRKNLIQSVQDAYLVFYSHPSSFYVRLKSVKREGNRIDVEYAFEPHRTLESTVHFALIPLGKLEAGEYEVHYTQRPIEQKYIDAGFTLVTEWQAKRFVCRPFSFTVYDPPASLADTPAVGESIPLDRIWALKMPGTRDVRELDPRESADETMIDRIGRVLTIRSGERAKAGPCFLVRGEGREALVNAAKSLDEGEPPIDSDSIPADEDLSLVFYS